MILFQNFIYSLKVKDYYLLGLNILIFIRVGN